MTDYPVFTLENLPDSFPLVLGQKEWNQVQDIENYAYIRFHSHSLDHLQKLLYFYLSFFPASLVYMISRQSKSTGRYIVSIFYEVALFQDGLDELYSDPVQYPESNQKTLVKHAA